MTDHAVDGIEMLRWTTPRGQSVYAAPFVIDLRYDAKGRATIDASYSRLEDYPTGLDRFGILGHAEKARILKAALARRGDFRFLSGQFGGYNLALYQSGIDDEAFLGLVVRFVQAWRRRNGIG